MNLIKTQKKLWLIASQWTGRDLEPMDAKEVIETLADILGGIDITVNN